MHHPAEAQYFLGQIYEWGHGVTQNLEKAIDYYSRAARQMHDASASRLRELRLIGIT